MQRQTRVHADANIHSDEDSNVAANASVDVDVNAG